MDELLLFRQNVDYGAVMNTKISCRFGAIFPIVFLSACGGIAGLDFDLDDDDSSSGGSGVQGPIRRHLRKK